MSVADTADQTVRRHLHQSRTRLGRWWADLPSRYKGLLVIALPLATIVVTLLVRVPLVRQQERVTSLLSRAADTRNAANELLLALLDVEAGAHGFALTGDAQYRELFDLGGRNVPANITRLEPLIDPGPERNVFNRVSQLATRRVTQAQQVVGLVQERGAAPAPSAGVPLTEGKRTMDEIRALISDLLEQKQAEVERSRADLAINRARLAPIVYVTFLGGLAGAVAAMWLFTTGIARRMAALERNAERLARGVPLRREPSRGRDEIGSLDRALRRASVMLRARDRELRALNTTLQHTVHEQELLNRELEAFSYSVSHDLRAPLRSIDGFAQALREDWGDRLDEAGQDHLARVRNAAQRMGRLIDDLIKLSRLTRAQVQRHDVNLSQIAEEVVAELKDRNPTRSVTWEIQPDVHANCDPSLARIVLENLLGNAWKFTSKIPDARIEFHAIPDTQPVWYVVRDNGAGFDMKYAEKLFAPFQRLHSERDFPGTGIGLATVQRIVRKHGGYIRTRAEVGGGATFYFSLEPVSDGVVAA